MASRRPRSQAIEATKIALGTKSRKIEQKEVASAHGSEGSFVEPASQLAIISFNVAGWLPTFNLLREQYDGLSGYLARFKSCGIFCVQETKVNSSELSLPRALGSTDGEWQSYWAFNRKKKGRNFNGVATWVRSDAPQVISSTQDVLNDADFDDEGRCLLTDHGSFCVFNVYAHAVKGLIGTDEGEGNGGHNQKERKFRFLSALQTRMEACRQQGRRVILVGDLNLTYRTLDCKSSCLQYFIDEDGCLAPRLSCSSEVGSRSGFTDGRLADCAGTWKSGRELLEKGITPEELVGYAVPPHMRHESDCVEWLQRLLSGGDASESKADKAGWVDAFAACHGQAIDRFTYWPQMTNMRYANNGRRLDYTITDFDTFKDSVVQTAPTSLPPSVAQTKFEPYSAQAALHAATNSGKWHAAPSRGNSAGFGLTLQRDDMRLNDSQFPSEALTGILYTPPSYSDHTPVSLLLSGEILARHARVAGAAAGLASSAETRRTQPWSSQRSVMSFFGGTPKPKQPVQELATPSPLEGCTAGSRTRTSCD